MPETISTVPAATTRQGHSALSVLTATLLAMIVIWLMSGLSFLTSVALGSFAGFCMAAWNWFRMGRRRKALVHVLLGVGVYLLFYVGYALLALLLSQIFPPAPPVETESNIPGVTIPGMRFLSEPQISITISIVLIAYCVASSALVLLYLYRATARDVPQAESREDGDELKRFLPLLAVAAISTAAVVVVNIVAMQIRTAQLQNHVYCELLQPGMTRNEVNTVLDKVGSHLQGWPEDTPYPALSEQATSYDVVLWVNSRIERAYNLDLWLGYGTDGKLVWKGRQRTDFSGDYAEQGVDTIECPWTLSNSLRAR